MISGTFLFKYERREGGGVGWSKRPALLGLREVFGFETQEFIKKNPFWNKYSKIVINTVLLIKKYITLKKYITIKTLFHSFTKPTKKQ